MMTKTQFAKAICDKYKGETIYTCGALAVAKEFLGELNLREREFVIGHSGILFVHEENQGKDTSFLTVRDLLEILPD